MGTTSSPYSMLHRARSSDDTGGFTLGSPGMRGSVPGSSPSGVSGVLGTSGAPGAGTGEGAESAAR